MDNTEFRDFSEKTLREIKIWAWAAAFLPLTALAGIFFVWAFGTSSMVNVSMVIGATTMFAVAVIWWWWALRAINILVKHWDKTGASVVEVLKDIREVRKIVQGATVETNISDR